MNRDVMDAQMLNLFGRSAEDRWIAAFQPNDLSARKRGPQQQIVDRRLIARVVACPLADGNKPCPLACHFQYARPDQPVMEDDPRPADQPFRPAGTQFGFAGASAPQPAPPRGDEAL